MASNAKNISIQWRHHVCTLLNLDVYHSFVSSVNARDQNIATTVPAPAWWRHQMETFSALLAICAGNSPVPGEFPTQRPVTRSFDIFFDLRPNKRLSKQWWGWWLETPSSPLWRHCSAWLGSWQVFFLMLVFKNGWWFSWHFEWSNVTEHWSTYHRK